MPTYRSACSHKAPDRWYFQEQHDVVIAVDTTPPTTTAARTSQTPEKRCDGAASPNRRTLTQLGTTSSNKHKKKIKKYTGYNELRVAKAQPRAKNAALPDHFEADIYLEIGFLGDRSSAISVVCDQRPLRTTSSAVSVVCDQRRVLPYPSERRANLCFHWKRICAITATGRRWACGVEDGVLGPRTSGDGSTAARNAASLRKERPQLPLAHGAHDGGGPEGATHR